MNIIEKKISELKAYKLNAKLHPQSQIDGIAESIRRFGFYAPIVIDGTGEIIIGHGRVLAAKIAGMKMVPAVVMTGLKPSEIRALRLIDNRIAETGWDGEMLKIEFESLDFDFGSFNISFSDIENNGDLKEGLTDPDDAPALPKKAKSKIGDLNELGAHRLLCGDATSQSDVSKLLGNIKPNLMVTDPPYGVNYDPNWRNEVDRKNGKAYGARAVGKVQNDDNADWGGAWALFPGNIAYIWHGALHAAIVANSLIHQNFNIRAQIIWAKPRFVIGRGDYHWQHEPCWYAVRKSGKGQWEGDRSQSTLWEIAHIKSETGHGTQKPIDCMLRPIQNNSSEGQAIYDPFGGSGTTMIAAEQSGRQCFMMEIDPLYCDVIIERWEKFTGQKAKKVTK